MTCAKITFEATRLVTAQISTTSFFVSYTGPGMKLVSMVLKERFAALLLMSFDQLVL